MRRLVAVLLLSLAALLGAPAAQARMLFDVDDALDGTTLTEATVVKTNLPTWVQVSDLTAPLYAADTGKALAASTKLDQFTFLRVLGAGSSRLQVDVYDESGTAGARGWVDASQVLPSAPGTDWLVASTATRLFRGPESNAEAVRNIDRFTPLQLVDGPVQNRVEVRVYRADLSAAVDQGWIDQSATGPALAPHTRVSSPTPASLGLRSVSSSTQQQAFLDAAAQAARISAAQTGVPASVTVAQAILESDWGRSSLAVDANNYFGMKAMGTLGSDGVVYLPTSEYDDSGQLYQTVDAFRAYKSLADSMTDHDRLLETASRYAGAMRAISNPKLFAQRLADAGYSTDPEYADKLIGLMDRYDLYRLDA